MPECSVRGVRRRVLLIINIGGGVAKISGGGGVRRRGLLTIMAVSVVTLPNRNSKPSYRIDGLLMFRQFHFNLLLIEKTGIHNYMKHCSCYIEIHD